MTRREPVERIIVLYIRIYILYIYTSHAQAAKPKQNAQLHVTYDSLTGIIFEFLSHVIWFVFEKCTYMYMRYIH